MGQPNPQKLNINGVIPSLEQRKSEGGILLGNLKLSFSAVFPNEIFQS